MNISGDKVKKGKVNLKITVFLIALAVDCGRDAIKRSDIIPENEKKCGCQVSKPETTTVMVMTIRWQRLLSNNETCPRCGTTEQELEKAVDTLNGSLAPMGIKVVLEKDSLSIAEFKKDPLWSNRIWINGRSLEDYIAGKAGKSPCCDVCGPEECRTIEVDGQSYEAIPSDMIIKAGMMAAAEMIGTGKAPCCGDSL